MDSAEKVTIILENRFKEDKRKKKEIKEEIDYNEKFEGILKKYNGDYLTFMDTEDKHILHSISADDTPESRELKAGETYRMTVV